MNKFLDWLLLSSKDANEWSLTIKSATYLVPTLLIFGNLAHLHFTSVELTQVVDAVSNVVLYVGGGISAVATLWGLVRKVWTSAVGTNDVINSA